MPVLVRPSPDFVKSFTAAVREEDDLRDQMEFPGSMGQQISPFARIMETLMSMAREEKHGADPDMPLTFWFVNGREYIGEAKIRPHVPKEREELDDTIGYYVRPSRRRRGYGKMLLKMALEKAREMGLERAYLGCNAGNVASRKVIEANGGVLMDEGFVDVDGKTERTFRYWIDL